MAAIRIGISASVIERELPAHQQHRDHRADDERDAHQEHRQALADEILERLDVGGHARHEQPGARAVEEAHRQVHDVVEHPLADVAEKRLADARHAEDRGAAEHVRAGGGDDEEERGLGDDVDVALARRPGRCRS